MLFYSKTYCPFCDQTKHLLNEQYPQESYEVINLNILDDGLTIQNQLYANTGQYMVPIIFINGQHVGGNSEVQQLHQWEIARIVESSEILRLERCLVAL